MEFFRRYRFALLIAAIIIFRFLYSLSQEFWFPDEDVLQIYLIGLKSFTTHTFPYFGADLVYNGSQIPGALQGYLVSIGWYLWKIPEAPYVTLNLLLDLSLGFLAWYSTKRLPEMSRIFIWIYIFLIPWSICYFTRIVNPSYVIPGAILFFTGILELYPTTTKRILPETVSWYFLGFGIFWIMQLHMSWVLLLPFTLAAFYYTVRSKDVRRILRSGIAFFAGCVTTGSLLLPTLLTKGIANGQGKSISAMAEFHPEHFKEFFTLLGMYFGYASFDQNRFRPFNAAESKSFLSEFPWAAPFMVITLITGIVLSFWLLRSFFSNGKKDPELRSIASIAVAGFLILFIVTLFSFVVPAAHAAVLFFPLVTVFALYSLREPMKRKWVRVWLYSAFISAFVFDVANGIYSYRTISIDTHREVIVKSLDQDNYRLVGKRRDEQ